MSRIDEQVRAIQDAIDARRRQPRLHLRPPRQGQRAQPGPPPRSRRRGAPGDARRGRTHRRDRADDGRPAPRGRTGCRSPAGRDVLNLLDTRFEVVARRRPVDLVLPGDLPPAPYVAVTGADGPVTLASGAVEISAGYDGRGWIGVDTRRAPPDPPSQPAARPGVRSRRRGRAHADRHPGHPAHPEAGPLGRAGAGRPGGPGRHPRRGVAGRPQRHRRTAGRFGQLGLRDLRLVTRADGSPYRLGGCCCSPPPARVRASSRPPTRRCGRRTRDPGARAPRRPVLPPPGRPRRLRRPCHAPGPRRGPLAGRHQQPGRLRQVPPGADPARLQHRRPDDRRARPRHPGARAAHRQADLRRRLGPAPGRAPTTAGWSGTSAPAATSASTRSSPPAPPLDDLRMLGADESAAPARALRSTATRSPATGRCWPATDGGAVPRLRPDPHPDRPTSTRRTPTNLPWPTARPRARRLADGRLQRPGVRRPDRRLRHPRRHCPDALDPPRWLRCERSEPRNPRKPKSNSNPRRLPSHQVSRLRTPSLHTSTESARPPPRRLGGGRAASLEPPGGPAAEKEGGGGTRPGPPAGRGASKRACETPASRRNQQ